MPSLLRIFCLISISLGLIWVQCASASAPKALELVPQIAWEEKAKGLCFAELALGENSLTKLRILRIDPKYYDFSLHSIGEKKEHPKTLSQWAQAEKLISTINASMYLPDGNTSTGYMRNGEYVNNSRRATKFGAYFLAHPKSPKLVSARIVEKDDPELEKLLLQYTIVIQNYRLINSKRKILWSKGGQKHSIAAVGQDEGGNILFFHSREPIDAYSFAKILLNLPLGIRTVMYVEGGVQAGMVLNHNGAPVFWGGQHPAEFFLGNVGVALPNVLGVKVKAVK